MTSSESGAPKRVCGNCMHVKPIHSKGWLKGSKCGLSGHRTTATQYSCQYWQISPEWGPYVKEKT